MPNPGSHDETATWNGTRRRDTTWTDNLRALRMWASSHGTPMAPAKATVTLDGEQVRIGGFVAYVRQRHRQGRLDQSRARELEQIPGWTWSRLPPGPRGHAERNEEIRRLRREGWTLVELSERYGMSRQRIHQIAPDLPDPVAHAERLERRRRQREREREAAREAAARRAGAS